MNKIVEVLLTVLALAGLYCAVPMNISPPHNSRVRAEQAVVLADGTDPMPFCRHGHCPQ